MCSSAAARRSTCENCSRLRMRRSISATEWRQSFLYRRPRCARPGLVPGGSLNRSRRWPDISRSACWWPREEPSTQALRVGERFGRTVVRAVKEGRLLYREAYRLTGLYGETFEKFTSRLAGLKG
jgi:hypothetical protein